MFNPPATYMILLEKLNGDVIIGHTVEKDGTGRKRIVTALEETKNLLEFMGASMLKDELITAYQIVKTDGSPIRSYEQMELQRLIAADVSVAAEEETRPYWKETWNKLLKRWSFK